MIRYTPAAERKLSLFKTPFEQQLSPDNRWVRMADLVPWDDLARLFARSMDEQQGRPSVDLRTVLGVLLVKHIEDLSDRRAIEYVQENIYAQYFVGLSSFQTEPVFVAHLLVTIRQRLGRQNSERLNDILLEHARRIGTIKHRQHPSDQRPPTDGGAGQHPDHAGVESSNATDQSVVPPRNRGGLMLDATVHPMNIAYPTDTRLLHEAREWSEMLLDAIFGVHPDLWKRKPRTYRRVTRKQYMAFSKKRKTTKKENRRALKGQLQYLRRNLKTLHTMLDRLDAQERLCPWTARQWRHFWIIQELYRQQDEMYRDRRRRVDDRIVSIEQPHVRPIKRGKAWYEKHRVRTQSEPIADRRLAQSRSDRV